MAVATAIAATAPEIAVVVFNLQPHPPLFGGHRLPHQRIPPSILSWESCCTVLTVGGYNILDFTVERYSIRFTIIKPLP
uniref:Uncharacterized protein n=1 Tax=Oryza sativa subsp. japonica TaxID=39947 RepID=Q2QMK6_ORYSJ|nr:hypothetical protein LOC_Os12g40850 [Oryza sativa Japonica Group]